MPLHLVVHFVARGIDVLPLGDAGEQHGSLHLAHRLLALRFLHLLPIELERLGVHALRGERAQLLFHAVADLAFHQRLRHREAGARPPACR